MKALLLMASLLTILFQPLAAAVDYFSAKTPVGSLLRTAEWRTVARELREEEGANRDACCLIIRHHAFLNFLNFLGAHFVGSTS